MEYRSWRTGIQIDNIYPIGSIYMSVNSTDPGTLFGGAWERIGGRFLLGADDTYTAGGTGGSTSMAHTHSQVAVTTGGPSNNTSGSTAISIAQMPSHNHGSTGNHTHGIRLEYGAPGVSSCPPGGNYGQVTNNTGYGYYNNNTMIQNTGAHTHTSQGSGSGHTHTLSSHTHSIGATTTGGASNADNMPPYLVVYMWQRVS